jgi:hypothetical protein
LVEAKNDLNEAENALQDTLKRNRVSDSGIRKIQNQLNRYVKSVRFDAARFVARAPLHVVSEFNGSNCTRKKRTGKPDLGGKAFVSRDLLFYNNSKTKNQKKTKKTKKKTGVVKTSIQLAAHGRFRKMAINLQDKAYFFAAKNNPDFQKDKPPPEKDNTHPNRDSRTRTLLCSESGSTSVCFCCGHKNNVGSSKVFSCSHCGLTLPRDPKSAFFNLAYPFGVAEALLSAEETASSNEADGSRPESTAAHQQDSSESSAAPFATI